MLLVISLCIVVFSVVICAEANTVSCNHCIVIMRSCKHEEYSRRGLKFLEFHEMCHPVSLPVNVRQSPTTARIKRHNYARGSRGRVEKNHHFNALFSRQIGRMIEWWEVLSCVACGTVRFDFSHKYPEDTDVPASPEWFYFTSYVRQLLLESIQFPCVT